MKASQQKTELFLGQFLCKAQNLEHLLLDIILMDTDASASDLRAVEHDIISLCPHPARIAVDLLQILFLGHGKGMMFGLKTVLLLGPLQQREIGDPHNR